MKNSIRWKIIGVSWGLTSIVLIFSTITLYILSNSNAQNRLLSELDGFIQEEQYEFNEVIASINDCGTYVRFNEDIVSMINSNPQNEYEINNTMHKVISDIETIYEMNLSGKVSSYSATFYVNDNLEISRLLMENNHFMSYETNGFRVYTTKGVKQQAWYNETEARQGQLNFFVKDSILYISQMITNDTQFQQNEKYMGVSVVGIKLENIFNRLETIDGYEAEVAAKKDNQIILKSEGFDNKHFKDDRHYFNESFETEAGIEFFVSIQKSQIGVQSTSLIGILAVFFVVTFALGLILSAAMSRVIVNPITKLVNTMRDMISTKNYGQHCEKTSDDEIGQLYDSFNHMTDSIKNLIDEVEVQTQKRYDIEYKLYQNRINPHMLYNTLDYISWKALMQGNTDIVEMNSLLADLYRYAVKCGDGMVKLEAELECAKKYITLQQMRNDYEIVLIVEENDCSKFYVPSFILQPLVENAIMHGYRTGMERLIIKISFTSDGQELTIIVENNGIECDVDAINSLIQSEETSQKIGLKNVNARINLKFRNGYGLRADKTADSNTQMIIKMPVVNHSE